MSTPTATVERRFVPGAEVRVAEAPDAPKRITGHAALFNVRAEIGDWFTEEVAPGAFAETLRQDDVRALFNHDANQVLGRNKAGTLSLAEDARGLYFEIQPGDTQAGRDAVTNVTRGDVTGASFGFEVLDEEWKAEAGTDGRDLRILKRVRLWDVGPVTFPAYEATEVGVRSHDAWKNAQTPPEAPTPAGTASADRHRQMRDELEI